MRSLASRIPTNSKSQGSDNNRQIGARHKKTALATCDALVNQDLHDSPAVLGASSFRLVLVRIMGLLLVAFTVQYFVNGVADLRVIATQWPQ